MQRIEVTTKPSPRALEYNINGVAVYLLPLDATITAPVQRRLGALYEEVEKTAAEQGKEAEVMPEGAKTRTTIAVAALLAFAAWDTPGIGWQFSADPDAVLFLEGPALLEAAETCRREMLNVSTLRLGIDSDLIVAVYRAMNGRAGLKDEAPAPGEDSPAES